MARTNRGLRPSPATIIAILALVVALSGTAYAAATIGTADIKNGAVTSKKLAGSAVTGKKLANGAVTSKKLAAGSVKSAKLGANSVNSSKVLDNSLTGADVDEASLDLSSFFASGEGFAGSCNADGGPQLCTSFVLTLDRPAPVLLSLSGEWRAFNFDVAPGLADRVFGNCVFLVNGVAGARVDAGLRTTNTHPSGMPGSISLVDLVPLPAGNHNIGVRCTDEDRDIDFQDLRLVAVQVNS